MCKLKLKLSLTTAFIFILIGLPHFQQQTIAQQSQKLLEQLNQIHFDFPDSALKVSANLESIAKQNTSLDTMAIARNKRGALYYLKSDYVKSIKDFLQAYEWAVKADNKKEIAYAENGIGLVYLGQLQYNKAIEAFNKALTINQTLADSAAIGKNLFNIGICKRELNLDEESITFFNRSLEILETQPKTYLYAMVLNQKAKSLYKLDRYQEAKALYERVLSLDKLINNWERTFAYTGIAEIQFQQSQFEEALINSKKGFEYAEQIGALWDKTRALRVMWQAEEKTGRIRNSLNDAKKYIALKDSLYNREKDLQVNSLQLELASLKNQNLENSLNLAHEKQRFSLAVAIGSTITIILLLILLFYFIKTIRVIKNLNEELSEKNKNIKIQSDKLIEMNKAKNQIFSIVSHDMRGPIRSIIQILDMEKAGDLTEEDKVGLNEMLSVQLERTRNMMDEMLNWANNQMDGLKKNPEKVNLEEIIREEKDKVEISLKAKKINYVFKNTISDSHVKIDINQLRVILQNLISNAIKFSHVNGTLTIILKENEDHKIVIIKDNGIGMDAETLEQVRKRQGKIPSRMGTLNEQGTGIGLLLTNQLLKANNIELDVESTLDQGSEFIIYIPIESV